MKKGSQPEQVIHKAIIDYLNLLPNRLMALTYKNTGTVRNGIYCPSKTTIKGVSDIIIFPLCDFFSYTSVAPFFLEVKVPVKGKQSDEQKAFEKRVNRLGYDYFLVTSVDDVVKILKSRGTID